MKSLTMRTLGWTTFAWNLFPTKRDSEKSCREAFPVAEIAAQSTMLLL